MALPLEGKWKVEADGTSAAGVLLKKGVTMTISTTGGNYTAIVVSNGHTWTIEYQSVDLRMISGGVDSGTYSFSVSLWPKSSNDKSQIRGMVCPSDYSSSTPRNDETEPGMWEAEEDPGGGDA